MVSGEFIIAQVNLPMIGSMQREFGGCAVGNEGGFSGLPIAAENMQFQRMKVRRNLVTATASLSATFLHDSMRDVAMDVTEW